MSLRKIKSQEEIDKRKKRTQTILGVFIAVLMILSTAGYAIWGGDNEEQITKVEYGGKTFIRQNNFWILSLDNNLYYFLNLPNETKDIPVDSLKLSDYFGRPLYFVNPRSSVELIISNFGEQILRYQEACLKGTVCKDNLPTKNCEDNVIIFAESNETKVKKEENCVTIYGDFEKGSDAFSYALLGVK